jgi:hypothetical protein
MLAQHSIAHAKSVNYLYAGVKSDIGQPRIDMGGKTDLDRVVAYVPSEWKKELEEWAEEDERSVSWVVSKLIDRALQERRKQQDSSEIVPSRLTHLNF